MDAEKIENEKPQSGLEKYQQEFLQDRFDELQDIKDYLVKEEYTALQKMAHKWKGFSEPYGFHHLAELSRNLEKSAQKNMSEECDNILSEIQEYLVIKKGIIKSNVDIQYN
ncbi:MAG: Hpt domain-containing protein [Halobacteriovoraceae bacterium]|nr:Hpt domain-containing protein [Halobacteriovoraceae bacterium]